MKGAIAFALMAMLPMTALISSSVQATETITLHFYERPPYMIKRGTEATGLTANPAQAAFTQAGIAFEWALTPAKRQLRLIKESTGLDCGVGWLKNPEREAFGKFSRPIYQDKPAVALVRPDFKPAGETLAEVLADPNLRVLMKSGLTYGKYVSMQTKIAQAKINSVTVEQPMLIRMISAGRSDLMFSTEEESEMSVTSGETGPNSLKVLKFPDIPPGETRHLLCSKKISDATMAKLDAAIEKASRPMPLKK